MIQLHSDCLVFETAAGQMIPCSAELISFELIGDATGVMDPELIRHAAAAVLHYFKHDLGRATVSVGEFSLALEQVLRGFGLSVKSSEVLDPPVDVGEADLRQLACASGQGFELAFFHRLRAELRRQLGGSASVLRFRGLRGCVKQLVGARRWSERCQRLSDQIVDYLRLCLGNEAHPANCALLVR